MAAIEEKHLGMNDKELLNDLAQPQRMLNNAAIRVHVRVGYECRTIDDWDFVDVSLER